MKCSQFIRLLKNEWPKYILFITWLGINIAAFVIIFVQFTTNLTYFYLRTVIKLGIAFAKASGIVININSCMLLLLVCRNLISKVRNILTFCPTNTVRIIDRHVSYHRYLGYIIIIFSTIHTLAHILNFEWFVYANDATIQIVPSQSNMTEKDEYRSLLLTLSRLSPDNVNPIYLLGQANNQFLNPVRTPNSNTIFEGLKLDSGVTGIVLCISLAIIASSSSRFIRRSFYNLFWYLHQICAVAYFLSFVVHGIQGIVAVQTNINEHDPQQCYRMYSKWPCVIDRDHGGNCEPKNTKSSPDDIFCDIPKFTGSMPTSWLYVIVPMLVYLSERIIRLLRGFQTRRIAYYKLHPSDVLELAIDNSQSNKINYRTGQYIYLKLRSISFFEWHPFTITSAPDDENLTVHIRLTGDWVKELKKKIVSSDPTNKKPAIESISVDGPYGSCAEDIYKYEEVILIGAGIGVTPYASILKDIWHKLNKDPNNIKIKKIHFCWICQNTKQFEWFGFLLKDLEQKLIENNRTDLVDYNLYLTRWEEKDIQNIIANDASQRDLFTNLIQTTNYGRPPFKQIFERLSQRPMNNSIKIGVFFCGLPQLSSELHKICNMQSNSKVEFRYNKESF